MTNKSYAVPVIVKCDTFMSNDCDGCGNKHKRGVQSDRSILGYVCFSPEITENKHGRIAPTPTILTCKKCAVAMALRILELEVV